MKRAIQLTFLVYTLATDAFLFGGVNDAVYSGYGNTYSSGYYPQQQYCYPGYGYQNYYSVAQPSNVQAPSYIPPPQSGAINSGAINSAAPIAPTGPTAPIAPTAPTGPAVPAVPAVPVAPAESSAKPAPPETPILPENSGTQEPVNEARNYGYGNRQASPQTIFRSSEHNPERPPQSKSSNWQRSQHNAPLILETSLTDQSNNQPRRYLNTDLENNRQQPLSRSALITILQGPETIKSTPLPQHKERLIYPNNEIRFLREWIPQPSPNLQNRYFDNNIQSEMRSVQPDYAQMQYLEEHKASLNYPNQIDNVIRPSRQWPPQASPNSQNYYFDNNIQSGMRSVQPDYAQMQYLQQQESMNYPNQIDNVIRPSRQWPTQASPNSENNYFDRNLQSGMRSVQPDYAQMQYLQQQQQQAAMNYPNQIDNVIRPSRQWPPQSSPISRNLYYDRNLQSETKRISPDSLNLENYQYSNNNYPPISYDELSDDEFTDNNQKFSPSMMSWDEEVYSSPVYYHDANTNRWYYY
ncbi:uncharacterized protein LOC127277684 [Leptopilina boulardi]|uniref:uncharacterized protein LOC127277684 n=1 Tax=Leptopilina boulardi TaxID=63433 RepID=UPI0021F69333|nr:uncharacterized protein LOC127277684 [Leptopilina boulardi]